MERIKKVAFIKIHDIWFDTEAFNNSNENIVSLHTNDRLDASDYDFELITKTFLLDISKELEDVFKGFEAKSTRYAINRAIRDEVEVKRIVSQEEMQQYMLFQEKFCEEKGIPLLNSEELQALECYYALSKEGEYLGACAFLKSADNKTVRYKYGATKHKLNANEIILWRAIQDYHNRDFQYFDFGGCIPTEDKESYYYRHFHFKKKFGGELIDSYNYFRIKGFYRLFYYIFKGVVRLFFKGDMNGCIVWLNQIGILK